MEKVSLINSGPELSRMIYGAWRLADDADVSTTTVRAKIDSCLSQGITTFDHADIYGNYECENVFGRALQETPSLREEMELITKCDIALVSDKHPERRVKYYDTSPEYIENSVNNSLKNLSTDYLDLLLLHRPDPLMDPTQTGRKLDNLIDSGKVRAVGVSNFQSWDWRLLQSHMSHKLAVNQIEISLLHRDSFTDGSLANIQLDGLVPMAWSPLGGGKLFGDSEAAARLRPLLANLAEKHNCGIDTIAIAWLLNHPAGILPIVGTNNLERIGTIGKAEKISLNRESWFELWTAAAGVEVP